MSYDDLSYDELRELMRERGLERIAADRARRVELLEIQAELDVRAEQRSTEMYLAAIPPGARSAVVRAAVAEAAAETPPATPE